MKMKLFFVVFLFIGIISERSAAEYLKNNAFLQIEDLDSLSSTTKKSLDEDSDIHESFKNKEMVDPLEALKSLKIKDSPEGLEKTNDNNNENNEIDSELQTKYSYDDLDEKLDKKLDDLDKESLDFFSNPHKKSKHSEKEAEEDNSFEEKSSKDDENTDILPHKRKILNKIKEEMQMRKPKKFSDEDLDEFVEENERPAPKFQEVHHSQAYLKHLEQMKKQKKEDDMVPPSKKDPILGSFMKNLQNIASGSNDSLSELPIRSPNLTPFNSIRDNLYSNYIDADKSLIKNLISKNVFNNLPGEVRNLIKYFLNKYKMNQTAEEVEPTKYFETNNVSITPSSQPFVDSLGKIGRRGFLTLINRTSLENESVWAILNGKVFCLYNSEDYVSIYRLFRNSALKFKDMIGVPCFLVFLDSDPRKDMLCSSSIYEKEMWLQAFMAANPHSNS